MNDFGDGIFILEGLCGSKLPAQFSGLCVLHNTAMLNECRYMVIIHPLRGRLSAGRALAVIAIIWVVSVIIASPNLVHADVYTWHFNDGSTRAVCFIDWPHEQADFMYVERLFSQSISQSIY